MPFNVLLLPLLGGYIFITKWNRTRFNTKRYSGERLIFHAPVAGVLFLAASLTVVRPMIPVVEIASANLFDPAAYERFQQGGPLPKWRRRAASSVRHARSGLPSRLIQPRRNPA